MRKIAVLRSNPKDAAIGKIVGALSRKYRVACFIWDRQHDYKPIVVSDNVRYVTCGIRAGYYDLRTLLKLVFFECWLFFKLLFARVDCIHAIDLDTGFVGLCVAKLRGEKFVYQCLDPYYAVLPEGWPKFFASAAKWLENFVISHADLFIITDLLRMPQHEGAKPKRIVEIANVPTLIPPATTETRQDRFVVGYIGSLTEGRNLLTLVEAAGDLCDNGVDLVIGGFGPLEQEVEAAARNYANVTYFPWVPYLRLLEIESTFDIFVQVLDKDNKTVKWGSANPNKLFESMAFGKPIIVGEGTLTVQKVKTFGNGIAVPYGSKGELKKAILYFKNNPNIAQEMGAKGKAEFERNWRPEIMEKRLLEAYAGLGL